MTKIMKGDCLSLIKEIESDSIDLILTDPPYNTTRNNWDKSLNWDQLWPELYRVKKKTTPVLLFAAQPFTTQLIMSNIKDFKYCYYWEKENGTGFLNAKKQPLRIIEEICVFYESPPFYNPIKRKGFKPYKTRTGGNSDNWGKFTKQTTEQRQGERFPINLLKYQRDIEKFHPTQKPIALLKYLIKTFTKENDLILDFTAGSGSSLIAALQIGRRSIGFEKSDKYYKIATERIENELLLQRQLKIKF